LEKSDPFLSVELRGDEIVVIKADFCVVYYKRSVSTATVPLMELRLRAPQN
jgi:hypothetical protein